MSEKPAANDSNASLCIIVLGASGDLAQKKTYPTIFALFKKGLVSPNTIVYGYARSKSTDEQFREKIGKLLKEDKEPKEGKTKDAFLKNCYYFVGDYADSSAYANLGKAMDEKQGSSKEKNRVFYLAVPPTVFMSSAKAIKEGALSKSGWNRLVIEKPFGRDYDSAKKLSADMGALYDEDSMYRIDHYLGKDMVQNLMVLRFANAIYEPVWNKHYISNVVITFKEDIGTEGRAGYFDEYGIIRDVMQNHLMQMLALVAMEPPVSLDAEDIRDEKVKVLRFIPPVKPGDMVTGQYGAGKNGKGETQKAYLDEPDVPKNSTTPTFATAVVFIENTRWSGVPFFLKCGKGLNDRKAEIRIQFKSPSNNLFGTKSREAPNELVIRVQPNESIYVKLLTKQPGLSSKLEETELDLTYKQRFGETLSIPDAYERLILDVTKGDHSLFVREDELSVSWKIFTPILKHLENIKPETYEYGSRGPASSDELMKKFGFTRSEGYVWNPSSSGSIPK